MESQKPKNNTVFEQLRQLIISGELKSGELLAERSLADTLGVSRTPIREGLRRLEKHGLVKHEPNKGVRVISVTAESVKHLYEVREALEGLSAKTLAMKASTEDITALEEILFNAEKAVQNNNIEELSKINASFHYQIARRSENAYLISIMETLQSHVRLLMSRSLSKRGRPLENIQEHWMIFQAIKQGDPELAESITKYHVRKAMTKALEIENIGGKE